MGNQQSRSLLVAVGLCAFQAAAQAQQPAPKATPDDAASQKIVGLEEIVVTAQKREEALQTVPIPVTAVGGEALERRQFLSVEDLPSLAPAMTVAQHAGYNRLFIRGIGMTSMSNGQDPSVPLHVDGVVIGRPSAQLGSFFDLERIEVLRGPQGTLYGRNATGGSVNLVTRGPTRELSGYLDVTGGNYDHLQFDGALSGPLNTSGSVRGRVAFQRITRDGYGRNVTLNRDVDDKDSWAVRGILEIDPTDNVDIRLSADYAREDDHNYEFHAFGPYRADRPLNGLLAGGTVLIDSRDVTTEVPTRNDREFWGLAATIGVDLTSSLRLQSITGYRDSFRGNDFDPDTTSAPVFSSVYTVEDAEQFSEELQLLYTSERLQGVVGLFYYDESLLGMMDLKFLLLGQIMGFPNAAYKELGTVDMKSYAAFTQWTYEVVDGLRLTAGVRYSDEKRRSTGTNTIFNFQPPPNGANVTIPIDVKRSWNAVTPKFGIDYTPVEGVMLYASATRGFKSGVLLAGNPNPPVNPEYIWSYEAGVKTTLLDRRLEINGTGFFYDFTDLQVNKIVGLAIVTENAATARLKGLELEMRAAPVNGVLLNADLTYLDTKFRSYVTGHSARPELGQVNLKGKHLVNAPKWTVNMGAELDLPLGLAGRASVRGDMAYSSRIYFNEFNEDNLSQKGVALFNASLQYESQDQRWRTSLFVKNLTDEKVASMKFIASPVTGFALNGFYKAPRTYGVRIGYRFE